MEVSRAGRGQEARAGVGGGPHRLEDAGLPVAISPSSYLAFEAEMECLKIY